MTTEEWYFPDIRLLPALISAGWFPGRWSQSQIRAAQSRLGKRWLAEAEPFFARFGGLKFGPNFVNTNLSKFASDDPSEEVLLENVLGVRVCPIGFASYIGQGGTVYVTENGHYLVANQGEIVYLGHSLNRVLVALVLYKKAPPPPASWRAVLMEFNSRSDEP